MVFDPPKKFLSDNGGEFANELFLELAESLNIRVLNTVAESPWSNGLVERHNGILREMLEKIMEECSDLSTALAWAIQAKNALANVHGFSPAQLALGYNPQLPSILHDKLPALEERTTQDIVTENLNCMRLAREAFIKTESSSRIRRALKHNVRPSSNNKFYSGDIVFYKRNDSRKWKGPGKVIGSESSNILIKHGANYVRVHACRVMLEKRSEDCEYESESETKEKSKTVKSTSKTNENIYDDESSEEQSSSSNSDDDSSPNSECEYDTPNSDMIEETRDKENPPIESDDVAQDWLKVAALDKQKIKKGLHVEFQKCNGDWEEGFVMNRTGKASGKYRDFWNVKNTNTGEIMEFDTVNDWTEWKPKAETRHPNKDQHEINYHDVWVVEKNLSKEMAEEIIHAKNDEIEKWIEKEVYTEVQDAGQEKLTTTWVVTSKLVDGKVCIKARLVVRGYEEDHENIRSDSPTCQKDNIRILLAIAVSKQWIIHSLDIKAAFLQGKNIERELYIQPPKEFRKKSMIWKLNKVVYGLCDASRSWYLKVVEVLLSLGMVMSKFDKAVFICGTNNLEGIMMIHVDDILYFGSDKFLQDMSKFKKAFQISREEKQAFKYLGVVMNQDSHGIIELEQKDYLQSMKIDLLPKESMENKQRFADEEETRIFRQGIGQLGWITSICKPEASFSYCVLSTVQSKPQISDFVKYAKVVRDLKSSDTWLRISKLNLKNVQVTVFSDASFGNLSDGGSQLAHIIFVHDDNGNSVPVSWVSKKAKRVCRSTLTAETLAAIEAVDAACVIKSTLEEFLDECIPPICLYVDNKSLFDAVKTTNMLAEKRLLIDMSALREMIDRKEVYIKWVNSEHQLADVLTKLGANKKKLTDVLSSGLLHVGRAM